MTVVLVDFRLLLQKIRFKIVFSNYVDIKQIISYLKIFALT